MFVDLQYVRMHCTIVQISKKFELVNVLYIMPSLR